MGRVQIFFIYADNCDDCNKAKGIIREAMLECKDIQCEIKMFNCEDRVSVNIAINNDIDDIPACVIGKKVAVFQGDDFDKDKIVKAIKKAAKQN